MTEFVMPKLGADMTEGKLVAWRKQPGDKVKRGDVVAEVDTEKGVIDVEIFIEGILKKWLIQPGETVPVGAPLAVVQDSGTGSARAAVPRPAGASSAITTTELAPPEKRPASAATGDAGRLRISPAARERARRLGVDLTGVQGSGAGGAITLEDVELAATTAKPGATQAAKADSLSRMRQTIAAAMSRSKREIPHYYLSTTIDMQAALTWLAAENEKRPVTERMLYGVLLLKAVALALRGTPDLNALWEGGRAVRQERIHVGAAISLRQGGLVAPAIHDTDKRNLVELMQDFRDLVNRVRAGSFRSSELSDPTITVTSLGEQGVETVYPIIYPPQVAIVGFGKVVTRPWVVDDQVMPRPVITATLAADHRVSDGHLGGLFLAAVDRLLQEPSKL